MDLIVVDFLTSKVFDVTVDSRLVSMMQLMEDEFHFQAKRHVIHHVFQQVALVRWEQEMFV